MKDRPPAMARNRGPGSLETANPHRGNARVPGFPGASSAGNGVNPISHGTIFRRHRRQRHPAADERRPISPFFAICATLATNTNPSIILQIGAMASRSPVLQEGEGLFLRGTSAESSPDAPAFLFVARHCPPLHTGDSPQGSSTCEAHQCTEAARAVAILQDRDEALPHNQLHAPGRYHQPGTLGLDTGRA